MEISKEEELQMIKREREERRLIEEIKRGDEAAFKTIYDRYQGKLRHYAFLITKSRTLADEILQEAFLKIWLKRAALKPELSFNHFLFKVAKNLAMRHLEKVARDERLKNEQFKNIKRYSNNTQDTVTFEEYRRQINAIVEALPDRKQSIYKLSRHEGKSKEEIAQELGISVKTVHNHLWEILQTIKERLKLDADVTLPLFLLVILS